jgi:uncharacterized repeat protein (TIGR01451 family)
LDFSDNNNLKQITNSIRLLQSSLLEKTLFSHSVVCFFAMIFSTNVLAAAGDSISNTATINYDIAGSPGTGNASVSFLEDRIINFTVTGANGGSAVPVISDMVDAVQQFTITNTGNAVQDFLLTAVNTSPNPFGLPADNFDPVPGTVQVFVESGVTPGYQVAEDTAVFVDELLTGASHEVYVVADMPTQAIDDVSAIALIAQVAEGGTAGEGAVINADDNGNTSPAGVFSNGSTSTSAGTASTVPDSALTMETVFNDPAGSSPEDVSTDLLQDVSRNGQHSDAGAYQVMSPVSITKAVTVIDTSGGTDPHPGATLRYQLDVNVAGNTAVDNLVITDAIPASTTYTDDSIVLNAVLQTDADDAPVDYSRAIDISSKPVVSIEVDLSQGGTVSVAPGATNVIIFEVTIN